MHCIQHYVRMEPCCASVPIDERVNPSEPMMCARETDEQALAGRQGTVSCSEVAKKCGQ
jgi:hypothetical protein